MRLLRSPSQVSASLVATLREQLAQWETRRPQRDAAPVSSGCPAFDRLLPWGGLPRGALVECLEQDPAVGGAGMLALLLARQAALEGGAIVVLDPQGWFYPPAAAGLGIELAAVMVVQARQACEQVWVVDQCLRCPAVAAVWAPLERLGAREFRRLQLAAESGSGLGLLVRSSAARRAPSWSDVQLLVEPRAGGADEVRSGRRLQIEITRCRHARPGGVLELEIDVVTGAMQAVSRPHEAFPVPPTAGLAYSTTGRRSARA
jgi:hypothetical protein